MENIFKDTLTYQERSDKISKLIRYFNDERTKCLDWRLGQACDDMETALVHCSEASDLIKKYDAVILFLDLEMEKPELNYRG